MLIPQTRNQRVKALAMFTTSARVIFGGQLAGSLLAGASRLGVDSIGGNDVV